jgi:OFA family oxalate/formate antiporter-like MFS transporter
MTRKIFYGWWVVVSCFIIGLYVSSVVFFGFTAFFEPLVKEFGWSYTKISFAASLRGLEMGIMAPLVGILVDRLGSRKLILCGTITVGCGLILFSLTQTLFIFYISFFLLAFGAGGCTSVVTMTAVARWFDKNLGKALGVMTSGFGASGLFIPVIVWLIDVYHWRTALIILGVGMWTMGVPLSFVIRNKPAHDKYYADETFGNDQTLHHDIHHSRVEMRFKEAIKKRSFLLLNLVETIRIMIVAAVITHIMPYLSSLGVSRSTAGWVAAAIPLFSIIGRFGFGWLCDVFNKRYTMAITYGLMGLGMLALCYAHQIWVIFLFLIFFSPGFGGSNVARASILREYFGRDSFGKMLGIVMGSASMGGIFGTSLAGWVFDLSGSYYFLWLAFCGVIGLTILLVLKIKP